MSVVLTSNMSHFAGKRIHWYDHWHAASCPLILSLYSSNTIEHIWSTRWKAIYIEYIMSMLTGSFNTNYLQEIVLVSVTESTELIYCNATFPVFKSRCAQALFAQQKTFHLNYMTLYNEIEIGFICHLHIIYNMESNVTVHTLRLETAIYIIDLEIIDNVFDKTQWPYNHGWIYQTW